MIIFAKKNIKTLSKLILLQERKKMIMAYIVMI